MSTKKYLITEAEVDGVAVVELVNGDWETGDISITICANSSPDPVRVIDCVSGRHGLNDLYEHIVGYRPDDEEPTELKELIQLVVGSLLFDVVGPSTP